MGAIRVTQQLLVDRALQNLAFQNRKILNLQEQLSTGLKVNRPSDNPIDARRAVNTRALMLKGEQYISNISFVGPPLAETSTSIETVVNNLNRAYELTVQGANGTNAQEQLDSIAVEINQVLEGMLNTANHITNGRYIFGGTRTMNMPFVATRDASGEITSVAYEGNDEHVFVQTSDDIQVVYNETGSDVFNSTQDVFQLLIDIRDNLRAGDGDSLQNIRLTEIENARDQLLASLARVGAIQNRLDRTSVEIEDFNFQLEELLSDTIDADFADVILELNAQSNVFQAALNAAGRVITPSLLDYV